jgi:hypothetical protein
MTRWSLRPEVMVETDEEGGITLVDPLFERALTLTAAEVAVLDAGVPEALSRLDALHLRSSPETDPFRRAAWFARLRPWPEAAPQPGPDAHRVAGAAEAAAALPWAPAWRDAGRWRHLIERGLASPGPLQLDGLFPISLVRAASVELGRASLQRLHTAHVQAERVGVDEATGGALGELRATVGAPAMRDACGLALGRTLSGALHLNAWRFAPGDRMAIHPDGGRYAGTVVVGLNEGWRAADGGAIAFGEPGPHGLVVRHRWLPEAGDVLLFAPTATSWHAVEPASRPRLSLSGWWMQPAEPRGAEHEPFRPGGVRG